MTDNYILDHHKPVLQPDGIAWSRWLEDADMTVNFTLLENGMKVSTVFIGVNSRKGAGRPLLFETKVFPSTINVDKSKGDYTEKDVMRYSTWKQAEAGHNKMVKKWSKK